ncbi:MAG: rhomboid family intramembrane serine protease [Solirubrobacteraceae bacterium]|nr:rhomboid family intramembrane serine protease [Solirubrobacteraceae bacterium]
MRYAGTERDDDGPWFRLGQLEVNTAVLVLLVWVGTLLIWVAEGPGRAVSRELVLLTDDVTGGQVWRLVTWPWAHLSFQLWDIINAAIFFLFATDLERQTGRRAFGWLIGLSIVIIGVAWVVLGSILGDSTVLYDLDLLALTVVLLYCAEHPTRPFFFNIPAWVIAAVIVALEVVNDLGERDWTRLLTVIVASALIALVAKSVGLLSAYDRVPEVSLPKRKGAAAGGGRTPKPSKPKRSGGGLAGRFGRREEAEIVEMPSSPASRPRPTPVVPDDVSADDLALDALLDKISAGGMDALTDDERRQLEEIRERRHHD